MDQGNQLLYCQHKAKLNHFLEHPIGTRNSDDERYLHRLTNNSPGGAATL